MGPSLRWGDGCLVDHPAGRDAFHDSAATSRSPDACLAPEMTTPALKPASKCGFGAALRATYAASYCPSAAMPLSRARSYTVRWALSQLPVMSCAHSFSAACCMARP